MRGVRFKQFIILFVTVLVFCCTGYADLFERTIIINIIGSTANETAPREMIDRCKQMNMSEEQVRYYFEHAFKITLEEALTEYEWPQCYAYGKVEEIHIKGELKKDGFLHSWKIWSNGLGEVRFDAGPRQFLFCKECSAIFNNTNHSVHNK